MIPRAFPPQSLWRQSSCGFIVVAIAVFLIGIIDGRYPYHIQKSNLDTFSIQKDAPKFTSYDAFKDLNVSSPQAHCHIDQSQSPHLEDLVGCRNASMFHIWRPKARLIAPRVEIRNGTYHVGYQCNPLQPAWGNMSQCSASTNDFAQFEDYGSWRDPLTIVPSQLYDIRGVFDGTIIRDGWDGYPTLIYTSAFIGPLGCHSDPPEHEGVETQSIAYTKDDGKSWIKLNFGTNGNPVIYKWPEQHLTGFRDPYIFESPELYDFYSNNNKSIQDNHQIQINSDSIRPKGHKFLLLSGGIRLDADPVNGGPRLFLYQQNEENNLIDWNYLGPLVSHPAEFKTVSQWNGPNGVNYECGGYSKLDEDGRVVYNGQPSGKVQLDIFTTGTEGGEFSHSGYWAIWHATTFDYGSSDGTAKAKIDFSGVLDWGRSYAFFQFPLGNHRQGIVSWLFEDDEFNVLTAQRGYQGAFTLFRDLFVQVTRNVQPLAVGSPEKGQSWTVRTEEDGSRSVVTLGQKIMPEVLRSLKGNSTVHSFSETTMNSCLDEHSESDTDDKVTNLVKFPKQPKDRFYAISAQIDFYGIKEIATSEPVDRTTMIGGGFRILSSAYEWTDIYYDPNDEFLIIDRLHSSAISSYGNSTERAKLRLWPILDPATNKTRLESLNLTIIVDNSALEVHANERAIISTRVYPWFKESIGVQFLAQGPKTILTDDQNIIPSSPDFHPNTVKFSCVELWDGLLNAFPKRPYESFLPGIWTHNITSSLYGLWPDAS